MVTFRQQLAAWKNVIFALFLRELQSKFNDKLGLSWAVLEPFLFIMILSVIRGRLSGGEVHGVPVFHFMLIGMMGIQSFLTGLNSLSTAMKRNKPLYAFRQVQPIASIISAGLMEISIKLGVIILLALTIFLMGDSFSLDNPILLISLFVMLWIFAISLSILAAISAAFIPEADKVRTLLTRPLFFISCVFFSLQDVPEEFWPWLTWNPLVHFIELARYACHESYGTKGVNMQYAIDCTLVSLFFALACYHITWKRILAR